MDMTIFWLVLMLILILAEIATMGLTTIWFAAAALVCGICAGFGMPFLPQMIIFIVVSLVLILFTRPIAMKYFNRDRVKTNAESLIGRQAIVTTQIDNLRAAGQVTVSGQEWTARSSEDGTIIPQGAVAEVLAINGVKLIVREVIKRQPEKTETPAQPVQEPVQPAE